MAQVGGAGAASLELRSRASRTCRAALCSISIPRPTPRFRSVVAAAREMRERLEALGLARLLQDHRRQGPACRDAVQGERQGRLGWPDAKAFARAICEAHGARQSRTTIWSTCPRPSARGKSFSTICATTACPRRWRRSRLARADGATVSMPLNWAPSEEGAGPESFHRPHRACTAQASQALDRLVRQRAFAEGCDPALHQKQMNSRLQIRLLTLWAACRNRYQRDDQHQPEATVRGIISDCATRPRGTEPAAVSLNAINRISHRMTFPHGRDEHIACAKLAHRRVNCAARPCLVR